MDFKQPERPVEDLDRRFEGDGTNGVIPKPQPDVVVKQKGAKGLKFLAVMLSLLLLAAAGYAAYAYMNEQTLRTDLDSAKQKAASAETEVASLKNKTSSNTDEEKAKSDMSDSAQQTRASLAATQYYCLLKDFGCDKVTSSVTKFQAAKIGEGASVSQDGFAIVTATPASNGTGSKFYVKSSDGVNWVVIFDGQNAPSTEVADKFEIPTSFR